MLGCDGHGTRSVCGVASVVAPPEEWSDEVHREDIVTSRGVTGPNKSAAGNMDTATPAAGCNSRAFASSADDECFGQICGGVQQCELSPLSLASAARRLSASPCSDECEACEVTDTSKLLRTDTIGKELQSLQGSEALLRDAHVEESLRALSVVNALPDKELNGAALLAGRPKDGRSERMGIVLRQAARADWRKLHADSCIRSAYSSTESICGEGKRGERKL